MQKTRLGISVGMLGAAVYLTGLFSGYLVALLMAGYVLLCEENGWLKRSVIKAVVHLKNIRRATERPCMFARIVAVFA